MILNAIPTAEGAIQIAMEEMPITLHNSECLVLGFGRLGKILSKMLSGIGAKVTVGARKYSDLAFANSFCYKTTNLNKLGEIIGNFDVIFNTIPSIILSGGVLAKIDKECLVID